ncbi:MAG: EutP/PduV family microcompartment system protein [Calditrichaceae bacterium]
MKKKPDNFMLIGTTGVGKSTLFNALLNRDEEVIKTQAMVYHDERTIDTPGEYLDNPRLYTALISTMTAIDTILYVHQSNVVEHKMPPGLFTIYNNRVIGVISKIDLPDARVEEVRELLKEYGIIENIFEVSALESKTIDKLRKYLIERNHIN